LANQRKFTYYYTFESKFARIAVSGYKARIMKNRRDELESFKTDINLTAYAASHGYRIDQKATSRNSAVMRHENGDKIVIARGNDRHWIYFSVRDHRDHGTVIDFVQRRQGLNLGQARQQLRGFSTSFSDAASVAAVPVYDLEPITRDLGRVRAAWEAMEPLPFGTHPYLNEHRNLSSSLLSRPCLADRIRCDGRGNAAFPHFTLEGLSGYELKNDGFTGFATGGTKGLWGNRPAADDTRLVITETAIDAISYGQSFGMEGLRLVSTGGEINPTQPELLQKAIEKLPRGEVIIATDNDEGGDKLASAIRLAFSAAANHNRLTLREHRPDNRGDDWNAVLCCQHSPSILQR